MNGWPPVVRLWSATWRIFWPVIFKTRPSWAFQLVAPLIVVGMVYNILIGLLSRLMPALPVFSSVFPFK